MLDKEKKKKRIIEIIENYADLLYDLAEKNDCWSGVNEDENKELINFIKNL